MKNYMNFMKPIYFSILIAFISGGFPVLTRAQSASEYNRRGVEAASRGDSSGALDNFDKSIEEHNRLSGQSAHNMGWIYETKGNIPYAIKSYEEAERRNPNQIQTKERLGYLYFTTDDIDRAITEGELVLKMDPNNQEVIQWLPDAYAKRFERKKKKIENTGTAVASQAVKDEKKKEDEQKAKQILYASLDTTLRGGYYFKTKQAKYIISPSYGLNVDYMLNTVFSPSEKWQIRANVGNPYLGALMPQVVSLTEQVEGIVNLDSYSLGLGYYGNHYKKNAINGYSETMYDFKVGLIIGKETSLYTFNLGLYPRMFPSDVGLNKGTSLDADAVIIDFMLRLEKSFKLIGKLSMRDYYIFNNDTHRSDYWGVYDFTAGIMLGDVVSSRFIFTALFTERLYLENLNNQKPFSVANGQGWFGIDANRWFKGAPLSGVKTLTEVLSFKIEERVSANIFLYQKIMIEIATTKQSHEECALQIGVGGSF